MPLPALENWEPTIIGLHQGARLLGAVQRLTQDPLPAYLELGLTLEPEGLSTGRLPDGGQVCLDFFSSSLRYVPNGEEPVSFPLIGHSQADIFHSLFNRLAEGELRGFLPEGETLFERVLAGIAARGERYRPPQRANLLNETQFEIDPQTAQDYWSILRGRLFTGIARTKARLLGMQTPLVVWPHGFDLSTLWFASNEINEGQFHINLGFSPLSNEIDYPYLYAYAYPYPPRFEPPPLPEGAHWHTWGWTGAVLPYDVIATQPDPASFVEASCNTLYQALLTAGLPAK